MAKDSPLWHLAGGAKFGATKTIPDSVTAFGDDLFSVSFLDTSHGLAGGSTCATAPAEPADAATCARVPVLYAYQAHPPLAPVWERVSLPGGDDPGYVGAIAWLGHGRAVAVGGDGVYPRRERAYDAADPTAALHDQAGRARAWELSDGEWTELTDLPADMRGLTALGFDPDESRPAFGFAGGLAQLWRWEGDGFTARIDAATPGMTRAPLFRFRVRQIRFVPGSDRQAFAVTAGCCAATPDQNVPRLMRYDGGAGRWDADELHLRTPWLDALGFADPNAQIQPPSTSPDVPDSFYAFTATTPAAVSGEISLAIVASPGGPAGANEPPGIVTQPYCTGAGSYQQPLPTYGDAAVELTRQNLSSARLVAGDGDVQRAAISPLGAYFEATAPGGSSTGGTSGSPSTLTTAGDTCGHIAAGYPGDGVPDWAVGELRSTALDGLGARGLLAATGQRSSLRPGAVDTSPDPNQITGYQPTSAARVQAYVTSQYYLAPSYALNAIAMVGDTGTGWAVGDHGALLRFGADTAAGAGAIDQKAPPALSSSQPAALPDTSPYDAFRPVGGGPAGPVPALSDQPVEQLAQARLEPAGSPDPRPRLGQAPIEDVNQVVMSRDGSEGWAIGPNVVTDQLETAVTQKRTTTQTLYHFLGGRWRRCDMVGVPGIVAADPACAQLAPLRHYIDTDGKSQSVKLIAAARVPLERDQEGPGNDDEFEVVATGTLSPLPSTGKLAPTLLRYREGRWAIEPEESRTAVAPDNATPVVLTDVAFTAPDDGWAAGRQVGSANFYLYHFDGTRWSEHCPGSGECQPGGRLKLDVAASNDRFGGLVAAGSRAYLYGTRIGSDSKHYPFILYHDRGASAWRADHGGWDPGFGTPSGDPRDLGDVYSLGVAQRSDGGYEGWAVGRFGLTTVRANNTEAARVDSSMLHLAPGSADWQRYDDSGVLHDYLAGDSVGYRSTATGYAQYTPPELSTRAANQVQLPGSGGGEGRAFIAQLATGRLFAYDPAGHRWSLVDAARPFSPGGPNEAGGVNGPIQALGSDARGGLWVAARTLPMKLHWDDPSYDGSEYFFHYTDRPHRAVFSEAPNPVADPSVHLTALAGAADGSVWLATDSAALYRYDRVAGWDRLTVPGWDPGRIVTRASAVRALAVGPSGDGVAVGVGGRIAQLAPGSLRLDPAAGTACLAGAPQPPCGTGQDLVAAAVAPDGSAIVAGARRALLWRPSGGQFRAVAAPDAAPNTTFTGASLPTAGTAYLTTDNGLLFAGSGDGSGGWQWTLEDVNAKGRLLSLEAGQRQVPLRAVAVDAAGHGYAVGDRGVLLERTSGEHPWRRLDSGMLDDLTSVALPAGGGAGALIGGRNGLVLTAAGSDVGVAREADYFGSRNPFGIRFGELSGPIVGLAVLPGIGAGEVEAWAASAGRPVTGANAYEPNNAVDRLFHYTSDPQDPLTTPGGRAEPLPDTPAPRPGELSFAAVGESQCNPTEHQTCPGMGGTTAIEEVVAQRVIAELRDRAQRPGGPGFVAFTGDAIDDASNSGSDVAEQAIGPDNAVFDAPVKFRRWRELVAERFQQAGLPLFGAIGGSDLGAASSVCPQLEAGLSTPPPRECANQLPHLRSGDNLSWRQAMVPMAAPWGHGGQPASRGLTFVPAPGQADASANTPVSGAGGVPDLSLPTGGARTHYALDIERDGAPVARLIVVDTSLKSLSAGDPVQQPREDTGGQLAWLERMLCERGTAAGCTRERGEPAIVSSTTPTYSYGPGGLTDTQTSDATPFEQTLLDNHASVVVSGRLGWNGLYYATAAGLHEPCPGGSYPQAAPAAGTHTCAAAAGSDAPDPSVAAQRVGATLQGTGAPAAPSAPAAGSAAAPTPLPFVVASSAGGRLDDNNTGSAGQGFWHGYTIVRVDASGDPARTIVEQRPVLDWVELSAPAHVMRPGQRMKLRGIGREPIGVDTGVSYATTPIPQVVRYDRIDSPAITHRYDLLEADPQRPYLPRRDANGQYVALDPGVATIDAQSGTVVTGRASHGRVYAIALLSVGTHAATYPLVFEPRRSYTPPKQPALSVPVVPEVRVLGFNAASIQPPTSAPPATTPPPISTSLQVPAPPTLPTFPTAAAPPVAPPAPPAPPVPPGGQHAVPINLSINPAGLTVPPTTGVTAQPTPPVNPSPPGGARKEARQKQAATAKSEEGGGQDPQAEVDLAQGANTPPNAHMTRRDRVRPAADGFTPLDRARAQPSAWTTGLEWGGGIGLMALTLALGFATLRSMPRRRPPCVPAPASVRRRP